MNPTSDIGRERLRKAIDSARTLTSGDRERYARLVRKASNAGGTKRSGRNHDELMRPIMLSRQSLRTFQAQLSGGEIRFYCERPHQPRDRFARIQEAHLNDIAREIRLSAVLADCVTSAFFKKGIVRLHMGEARPLQAATDMLVVPGMPSATYVPFPDFFEDMTATRKSKRQFYGHDYDVGLETLRNDPNYKRSVVNDIEEQKRNGGEDERQAREDARTAYGHLPEKDRLAFDVVRLRDVYVPHLKKVFTFHAKMNTPCLRELVIDDPDGPYAELELDKIPDNILACSQAESLEHLDDLHNSEWRKISMMVAAARTVVFYEQGNEDAADEARKAAHGKWIASADASGINPVEIGGAPKNLVAASALTSQWYDRMDDGLAQRAGLYGNSSTATEAELQAQASGSLTSYVQQRIMEFYSRVGDGLRRLMWDDEAMYRDSSYEHKQLPGYRIRAPWRPGVREGDRDDYKCSVIPYTVRYESPEAKVNKMLAYIERLGASGLLQQFAQVGRIPDPDEILDMIADASGPAIKKIFQVVDPVEPGGSGERPLQTRNKTSTQIRKSEAKSNPMQETIAGME